MIDDDLKALERRVHQGGGGALERLRYAQALERVGRPEEAYVVLLRGVREAGVRREIGRRPAWGHPWGDAGRTRFCDVAPVTEAPALAWKVEPDGDPTAVLPSPLGVVVSSRRIRPRVLDPATGAERWRVPGLPPTDELPPPVIAGDVLIDVNEQSVAGFDLFTGAELHRTQIGPIRRAHHVADRLYVETLLEVRAFEMPDPREAPRPRWSFGLPGRRDPRSPGQAVATPETVFAWGLPRELCALDPDNGAIRWRASAARPAADSAGLVGEAERRGLIATTPDGDRVFTASRPALLCALAPDAVVVGRLPPGHGRAREVDLEVVDRATGEARGGVGVLDVYSARAVAIARDVVYAPLAPGELGALRLSDGSKLWSVELTPRRRGREGIARGKLVELAAADRSLYGRTADGEIIRLGLE